MLRQRVWKNITKLQNQRIKELTALHDSQKVQLHVKSVENERMRAGMDSNLASLKRLKVAVQKKF